MDLFNPYYPEVPFRDDQVDLVIFPNGDILVPTGSHSKFLAEYFREDAQSILPLEWGPEYFANKHGVINVHSRDTVVLPRAITDKQLTRIAQLHETGILKLPTNLLFEIAHLNKYHRDIWNEQMYEKKKSVKMEHGYESELKFPPTRVTQNIMWEIQELAR
jgi:hypothetical protein